MDLTKGKAENDWNGLVPPNTNDTLASQFATAMSPDMVKPFLHYLEVFDSGFISEVEGTGIHYCNSAFFNLFKIDVKDVNDLLNTSIFELFKSLPSGKHLMNEIPGLDPSNYQEITTPKKKKFKLRNHLTIQVKYFPVVEEGKLVSRFWLFDDITIQTLTEFTMSEREEKYRGILENMELGILEVDNNGHVVRAYDRFCSMTGYSQEELLGKDALELLVEEDERHILQQQTADRAKGKASVYEIGIIKKNGEKIWVLISGAPIMDSNQKIVGTIGLHYDITDRKRSVVELEKAKVEAEAAKEAEKQFLANVSHEMRTPLNAILGMTNLLNGTNLNLEQREYLEMLDSSSNMLHSLITDILDISKIDAGEVRVNKSPFDLIKILTTMVRTFSLRMESKPVEVRFVQPDLKDFWVNGDLLLFRQILNNLIGNACKFTKKGSVTLELRLQLLSDSTVKVCIDVIDTGIGIADEEQQLIFQKFKQASNNKEKHYSGTGLGLVITKKLVELQNGTIQLKSRLNEGSTFSIHIPFERCDKIAEIEEQEIDVSSIGESKILIVEDNYLNQRYITTLMKKWSIDYELAKDGLVAVDLCKKEKFDLVLMDVNMPKLDGFEASRKILGSCKYNKSTPIVALTASGLKHTKVETERVGMVDFLLKPLHPEDLKKILVKYCPKRAVPKSDMERFIFDSSLDSSYLDSIFDGDVDYAKEMFEIFFESTAIEFKEIEPYFENNDYGAAKSLVHKLKPSFHMVGLTRIGGLMDELERQLQDPDNNESSRLLFNKIQEMYASAESVLKRDLERMQDFLTK